MTSEDHIVTLRLAMGDPIRGTVGQLGSEPRPFTGWLELVSAIEEVRTGDVVVVPGAPRDPHGRGSPSG